MTNNDTQKITRGQLIFVMLEIALFFTLGFMALGIAASGWAAEGSYNKLSPVEYFAAGACCLWGLQAGVQGVCYLIRNRSKIAW